MVIFREKNKPHNSTPPPPLAENELVTSLGNEFAQFTKPKLPIIVTVDLYISIQTTTWAVLIYHPWDAQDNLPLLEAAALNGCSSLEAVP